MVRRRPHAERSGRFRLSSGDVVSLRCLLLQYAGVFEDADHFTLEMFNFARWLRTILLAGITFLQWEEVTTPAPTSLTTPSPTPEPAEATASLTPSPTCAFDLISGVCGATCSCITSPNYPENYAPDGSCVIKLASLLTLDVKDFRTEVLWDTMVVNCQNCSGSTGPVGVEADGEISCFSDGAGRDKSWSINADMTTPAPTPPLTPSRFRWRM